MVKFAGTIPGSGRTVIGFGLTAGNISLMKEGKTIQFSLEEMSLPFAADILIIYGDTEEDLAAQLGVTINITEKTKIHLTEEDPGQQVPAVVTGKVTVQ